MVSASWKPPLNNKIRTLSKLGLKFCINFSISTPPNLQIEFMFLISRQGKTRLTKWFGDYTPKLRTRVVREVTNLVLGRPPRMCSFIEYKDQKIVYKRYASLFFVACVSNEDNELITLEKIHLFVEILDRYFGNVCELDIIFNFHRAYYILDELMIGEWGSGGKWGMEGEWAVSHTHKHTHPHTQTLPQVAISKKPLRRKS